MMTWGLLASFSLAFLFLMAWSILVAPLMSATLMRAMDAARQGDAEALTLASPFRGLADNAGSILMLHVVGMFMVLIGSMFCVIPGLIAGIVVGFATPMVALDRVPPMEALGHSWRHFTSHLSWHLLVWVIHVAIAMVVGMVGVGAFLAIPLAAAFQMAAYRVAYGDGGVPRTAF